MATIQTYTKAAIDAALGTLSGITANARTLLSHTFTQMRTDLSVNNVDNTSDATKNAAVATLTNKTLTAPVINSPTGIVKGDVGLGNVDNTSDANKPVSTATQTALDLKAPLANPTFTGNVVVPDADAATEALNRQTGDARYFRPASGTSLTDADIPAAIARDSEVSGSYAPLASPTFTGTPAAPTAAQGTNTTQVANTAYVQTEAGLLVPKSVLTTDGDILTRSGGVVARITRAALAADSAFSTAYQALHAKLTAVAGMTWAADKGLYTTSTSAISTFDLTSFARTLLDDANAAAARSTIGVAEIVPGTQNGITVSGLMTPSGDDTTGIIVKSPSTTWGATGQTAAYGNANYGKGQFISFFKEGGTTASDSMLFRVDRTGGMGLCGAVHIATGLNQRAGYTANQCIWVNPYTDAVGLVIHNPTTTDSATWTRSFLSIVDVRSSPTREVFAVENQGTFSAPNGPPSASRFRVLEHFEGAPVTAVTTNSAQVGASTATTVLGGTGASVIQGAAFVAGTLGVAAPSTGTTTTGYGGVQLSGTPITFTAASSDFVVGCRGGYLQALSTSGEQFEARFGLVNTGTLTDALYFRLQHGDTNWECVNLRAGSATVVDSGVAAAATTMYNFKIVYTAGGNAVYFINGAQVASISTNKPTDATALTLQSLIVKAAGTTSRALFVDAMTIDVASDINLEQILA